MKNLKNFPSIFIAFFVLLSCAPESLTSDQKFSIIDEVQHNNKSPFYIATKAYPQNRKKLPIGVFDSGTGGLTVLNTIFNLDRHDNKTHTSGSDGELDFKSEKFIYLADEANMPYGRYDAEGKADFLRELILKDVRFLIGDSYYNSPDDINVLKDKQQVKAIVIACNTATAYGLKTVQQAIEDWGLDIRIMGIVDAGSKAVLQNLNEPSGKVIGVLATEGTCSSNGYPGSIRRNFGKKNIAIIQQPGIGLAGAIDGDLNYIDPAAVEVRDNKSYQGPDVTNSIYKIDNTLWDEYNFTNGSELILSYNESGEIEHAQLNSVGNYIKYMVTHMVVNMKQQFPDKTLSSVILGCTHYPYFTEQIRAHFLYLKNLKPEYDQLIAEDIVFVDPSESLALELHNYLDEQDLWGHNNNADSRFFISVPNTKLNENKINEEGEFPYDYKYGRMINSGLQYVKVVPFSDRWIKSSVRDRMKADLPYTYQMIYQN